MVGLSCGPLGLGLAPSCIADAATTAIQLVGGIVLVGLGVLLIARGLRLAGLVAAGAGILLIVV